MERQMLLLCHCSDEYKITSNRVGAGAQAEEDEQRIRLRKFYTSALLKNVPRRAEFFKSYGQEVYLRSARIQAWIFSENYSGRS